MYSMRAASDYERDMLGRSSLPLLGALPLAVLALAGCGGNASHAWPTTGDGGPARGGVSSTGLGAVLGNRQGHPLYTSAAVPRTMTTSPGPSPANWPRL